MNEHVVFMLQLVINGIAVGGVYSLMALGFVLIFKASSVVNFGPGELVLFGAYVAWATILNMTLPIPIALVLILVPGPFWIRGMAALGGILLGLFFSLGYMTETTENRVKRAGYPAGSAQAARDRAAVEREAAESERRRAAAVRRGARYRERRGD